MNTEWPEYTYKLKDKQTFCGIVNNTFFQAFWLKSWIHTNIIVVLCLHYLCTCTFTQSQYICPEYTGMLRSVNFSLSRVSFGHGLVRFVQFLSVQNRTGCSECSIGIFIEHSFSVAGLLCERYAAPASLNSWLTLSHALRTASLPIAICVGQPNNYSFLWSDDNNNSEHTDSTVPSQRNNSLFIL